MKVWIRRYDQDIDRNIIHDRGGSCISDNAEAADVEIRLHVLFEDEGEIVNPDEPLAQLRKQIEGLQR